MASPAPNPCPDSSSGGGRRISFRFQPSRQNCLILACLMGLLFAGGVGLYVWQTGQMAAIESEVKAKEEKVASSERTAKRLLAVEAEYADMQEKLRRLETSVTAGEYVPTLLRQMEGLAKSVQLQVGAVRPKLEPAPEPPKEKEARKKFVPWPYDKIHIEMEVRGSYWNIAKLLYQLTEFPKIMAVESVQVQPGPAVKTGKSTHLTANLKLTGFIFKNEEVGGKAASGAADAASKPGPDSGGTSLPPPAAGGPETTAAVNAAAGA